MTKIAAKKPTKPPKKSGAPKKQARKKADHAPKFTPAVITESVQIQSTPKIHKAKQSYLFAVGRRKSSISRVRYFQNEPFEIIVNEKQLEQYFPYFINQQIVLQPLTISNNNRIGKYQVKVTGGGSRGQAESTRLAISRVLLKQDSSLKPLLKAHGLLVRDSRVKERKKYGLKSARRAPQWQKR